jgi:hypothetical protein
MMPSENNLPDQPDTVTETVCSSPTDNSIIRRVEITCELFEMAFEIKSLELRRRNPDASDDWIRDEALRLIEVGSK